MNQHNEPPNVDAYTYRVHYSPEDECFIGEADEFHGMSALADTAEEALREIKVVVAEGLQLLKERNYPQPKPFNA